MGARRSKGEGTVHYDVTRDRWVGQAWIGERRRKVTGRTKREVTDKLGALRHADAIEQEVDRNITVGALLDEWRAKAVPNRNLTPGTIGVHDWAIESWRPVIGSRKAAELRPTDIERALVKINKRRPMARSTMVKLRSTLNQAMAWAVKRGDLARNPVVGVELPSDLAAERPKVALTVDQLDALRAELVGHPMEALFLLSAGAGLRPGEAAAVQVDAIDLKGKIVKVVGSVRLHHGKPYLSEDVKNAKSRRAVELRDMVVDALTRHLKAAGIRSGLLFTAPDGGPVWSSTVRSELTAACTAAGVPVVTPNELRHTFTTHAVDAGIPPHVVADMLGHTNTRMIERHYRHRPLIVAGARMMDAPTGTHRGALRAV
jgi:integrase